MKLFLGPKLLAQTPHPPGGPNQALFCPRCGEVWARRVQSPAAPWWAKEGQCSPCGGGSLAPFWTYPEEDYLALLVGREGEGGPYPQLLAYEARVLLRTSPTSPLRSTL
jgi:hypothetical protein